MYLMAEPSCRGFGDDSRYLMYNIMTKEPFYESLYNLDR